jgi:predicted nucleic acid-binding protein
MNLRREKKLLDLESAISGGLRVIKEAKDRGLISKAKPLLDELIASSTYLDESLYQRFLREMGEEEEVPPK